MTTAQVVETPVTVNNSPIQDYVHPDDQTQPSLLTSLYWRLFKPLERAFFSGSISTAKVVDFSELHCEEQVLFIYN